MALFDFRSFDVTGQILTRPLIAIAATTFGLRIHSRLQAQPWYVFSTMERSLAKILGDLENGTALGEHQKCTFRYPRVGGCGRRVSHFGSNGIILFSSNLLLCIVLLMHM